MYHIRKGSGAGYFNTRTSIDPLWDKETNGPVVRRAKNKTDTIGDLIFWDPKQPLYGPVYHLVVNFRAVGRVRCTGDNCALCKETIRFNQERRLE